MADCKEFAFGGWLVKQPSGRTGGREKKGLGASGAVMGFEGLYLAMAVRWHLPDPHIWPMARPIPPGQLALLGIMGLVLDYMGFLRGNLGVAYSAHLGGFVGGLILGSLVVPMPRLAHRR